MPGFLTVLGPFCPLPPSGSKFLAFPDSRTMRDQSVFFVNDPGPSTDGKGLTEQSVMQTHDWSIQRPASCCQLPRAPLGSSGHFALFFMVRVHFSELTGV